jgi:hypothetical protein
VVMNWIRRPTRVQLRYRARPVRTRWLIPNETLY